MKAFVPIEKQSKKARRACHVKQRRTWGAISPVTRKAPEPRAYKRKKIHIVEAEERHDVDFLYTAFTIGHDPFMILSLPIHCTLADFIVYSMSLPYFSYGGALVSTGLLRSGKRVVDLVGHFKKRETQVIAKPQLIAA